MKRAVSILLVTLLLLVALPTFAAEGGLQAGLYVSEAGTEVLYLDEKGVGVLNYVTEQYEANGVIWTEDSLEIEHVVLPFTTMGDVLFFTYNNMAMALRYQGKGEAYALGEWEGTAFAGTYLAEDGSKLVLNADGEGVFTDSEAVMDVFWGSLMPYWVGLEDVDNRYCYLLFDSYLCGLTFEGDTVVVNTEYDGDVTFQRQAAPAPATAEGGDIYYGYRMTTEGQTMDLIPFLTAMGMDPKEFFILFRGDGTGRLQFIDPEEAEEFTWTEDTISVDGESINFTREGDHIFLSVEDESIEFAPAAEVEALMNGTATEENKGQTGAVGTDSLVGTWTFTKAKAMGMESPASSMCTSMTLILKEDGTASLSTDNSENDLEWSLREDGSVLLSVAGTEIFTLSYDGTNLTLIPGTDAVEMVFEKEM